ncbi:type II toxin-antitoxin system RelE/ParE family toxin [Niveispirillum irakense]|uniref:type II toxin-antitoxin system RelE/ParE family toxin n=1 Tax=Niveispirillum irakense TaxID=34011 RepID=UPI00040553BE|nr:type II toxin-antitoxin system RelE/ParE family toxin [Niveispirillum irakense]
MVKWSETALADIAGHAGYIATYNPYAAGKVVRSLHAAGNSLATFPRRGRVRPDGLRELTIIHPYVLVYQLSGEDVLILRIWHGAQER